MTGLYTNMQAPGSPEWLNNLMQNLAGPQEPQGQAGDPMSKLKAALMSTGNTAPGFDFATPGGISGQGGGTQFSAPTVGGSNLQTILAGLGIK